METTANTPTGYIEIIAANLCKQLIAFQNTINARSESASFPDGKEIGFLVKLINCLDKLRKMTLQTNSNKEFQAFLKYLKTEDSNLSKTVTAKYKSFQAQNNSSISTDDNEVQVAQSVATQQLAINPLPNPPESKSETKTIIAQRAYMAQRPGPDGPSLDVLIYEAAIFEIKMLQEKYKGKLNGNIKMPTLVTGKFDHLVTYEEMKKFPMNRSFYFDNWDLINAPCKETDTVTHEKLTHRLFAVQYKLRYIHFKLEIEAFERQIRTS